MDLAIFKNSSAVGYCSLVLVEMITLVSSCTTPILITRLHTDLSQLAISQFPVAFFTNNLSRLLHTSHPSSLSINCWAQSAKSPERFHAMLLELYPLDRSVKKQKSQICTYKLCSHLLTSVFVASSATTSTAGGVWLLSLALVTSCTSINSSWFIDPSMLTESPGLSGNMGLSSWVNSVTSFT